MNKSSQAVTRSEHNDRIASKRVQLVDPFGGVVTEGNYEVRWDESYIGQAQIGTLETEEGWQILKIGTNGVSYADSTDEFIKVWEDRDTYTYTV
jgi:hypothetical protein